MATTVRTTHDTASDRPQVAHPKTVSPPEPPKTYKVLKEFVASNGARWGKGATGLSFDAQEVERQLKLGTIEEESAQELKK